MTFTYVGTLLTDLDTIRFNIQDTVSGSGAKPDGGNFTDEEIAGILTIEGNTNRATARLFESLASVWNRKVNSEIGPRREEWGKVADNYEKQAVKWRANYGYGGATVVSGFVTRVDGYSDDIDSGEV